MITATHWVAVFFVHGAGESFKEYSKCIQATGIGSIVRLMGDLPQKLMESY
jgi:hypothetical protein